jgi:transcriptional regulator with XRE-family HTH domain
MGSTRKPASDRLRAWRAERGLSQPDVAELIGCSVPWVSQLERGLKLPGSIRLALAIERVTGIDADDWPTPERKPRKRREAA